MGCHFLLQCMKVKSESEVAQSCPTLRDPMDCSLPDLTWVQFLDQKIPWRRKWQPTPVFLPGKSQGQKEPGGLQFMGSKRVRHDLMTQHHHHSKRMCWWPGTPDLGHLWGGLGSAGRGVHFALSGGWVMREKGPEVTDGVGGVGWAIFNPLHKPLLKLFPH